MCKVIAGKAVNLGDGDGMHAPCILNMTGKEVLVEMRKQEIH